MPREPYLLVVFLARILFAVVFLRLVWRIRAPIPAKIRGDGRSAFRRILAKLWPHLMTAYGLCLVAVMTLERLAGRLRTGRAGSEPPGRDRDAARRHGAVPAARAAGGERLGRREGPLRTPASDRSCARPSTSSSPSPALLVIVRLWNLDLLGLATRGLGARVAGALIDIGLTVMLAYLVWQVAKTAIDRRLAREAKPQGVSDPGEVGGTGGSRIRTLLPLARGTVFAVLCVMSVLTVLLALGVNIGPLLAGAGVVGLAVGFGAETLVRDIISGAFYLIDDAFRPG